MNEEWLKKLPIKNIKSIENVKGGDSNKAYRLSTENKDFFLLMQKNKDASVFDGEVAGLKLYKEHKINAPEVISYGTIDNSAYLILSYIEEGSGSQADLGRLVSKLHSVKADSFGFDFPYVGTSSSFNNDWTNSWIELFVERRLDVLADDLIKNKIWTSVDLKLYLNARKIIINVLEIRKTKPSLLHGDLWAGNYMFNHEGRPYLIDPAPLYGDREFDVAITTVFGGFGDLFYKSYNNEYPLDEGFATRKHFYRLYFLMVHLLKFGNIYHSSVKNELLTILNK